MQLNRTPSSLTRDDRNKLNENWGLLEQEIVKIGPAAALAKLAALASEEANAKSENVQAQLSTLVINGDSSPAAAQAAVDAKGIDKGSLKRRIDDDYNEVAEKLAATAKKADVRISTDVQPINIAEFDTETKLVMTGGSVPVVELNAIGEENIKRGAVTPEKMEYPPLPAMQTRNLFDKRKYTPNSTIVGQTGAIVANPYPEFDFAVTHFILVEPGETYTRTNTDTLAYYDAQKKFISIAASGLTYTIPTGARYVRYVFRLSTLHVVQFEKGTARSAYVEFGYKFDTSTLINGAIKDEHLKESYTKLKYGKNLFDKNKVTIGKYIAWDTGNLGTNETYGASDFIEVETGQTYVKTGAYQYAFYDQNKAYISGVAVGSVLTVPANAKYVRLSFVLKDIEFAQFEKGTVATGYEPHGLYLEPTVFKNSSIDDKYLKSQFAKKVPGKNLFDKNARTIGYYPAFSTGALTVGATFSATDWMPCLPSTTYTKSDNQQVAFYNAAKVYVSGLAIATTFTTPESCYFMRAAVPNSLVDSYQVEVGLAKTAYETFGYYINPVEIQKQKADFEKEMKIQLPRNLYLTAGEEFSIYWRNVISLSSKLKSGDYYIRAQKVVNGIHSAVGEDYGDKWSYTPTTAETFDLEIRLYHTYRAEIITQKSVKISVVSKTLPAAKEATAITIGDSFTDGYGISRYIHDFVTNSAGATLNMIGLNDGGKAGVKDNAWSGQSYDWFYGANVGYLRNDRPLSHANWDPGWGENEVNGWKTGQTWADLTNEQRSHGATRNEFFNPAKSKFDFAYFMTTYFPEYVPKTQTGKHVDTLISLLGVNDSTFKEIASLNTRLPVLKERISEMIASIHSWDPTIKIMLHLVTPQAENDSFMNSYGGFFSHGTRAKYAQEIWNDFMLENFDTLERMASNVFVVATNAHFDPVSGLITKVVKPNKFDQTIERVVTNDVHPTPIGSMFIADTVRNFLINKVLR